MAGKGVTYILGVVWRLLGLFVRISVVLFSLAVVCFIGLTVWAIFGTNTPIKYSKPKHCDPINLQHVEQCSGFTTGGFQNSQNGEMIASGKANKQSCLNFKEADFSQSLMPAIDKVADFQSTFEREEAFIVTAVEGVPLSQEEIDEQKKKYKQPPKMQPEMCTIDKHEKIWNKVACPQGYEDLNCYHCTRFLSNGNGYRYTLISFSLDCERGKYHYIADNSRDNLFKRVLDIEKN